MSSIRRRGGLCFAIFGVCPYFLWMQLLEKYIWVDSSVDKYKF